MSIHEVANILRIEFSKGRARPLHVATVEELGGFEPKPRECHENARRWVVENPSYRVVEGWVAETDWLFVRHSVVEKIPNFFSWASNPLVCVTLGPQKRSAPSGFVLHQRKWTREPFALLPAEVQISPDAYST